MLKMLTTSVTTLVFIFIHVFITNGVLSVQYFDRFNYETNTVTKCGNTTCLPGTQIKPCEQNYTMYTCERCPKGTEMLDNTTSRQDPLLCVKKDCSDYAHTIDSTEINYCSVNGVHLPCKCDVKNGFCGDPCNCRRYHGNNCQPGEILHHSNCSCIRDPVLSTIIPAIDTTTTESTQTISYTRNLMSDPVTSQPSVSQDEDEVSWKTIGVGFGLYLPVGGLIIVGVALVYKYRQVFKELRCSHYSPTPTNEN